MNYRVLLGMHTLPGHLNPMIGVAQRLFAAGCDIATFSEEGVADRMARAGVRVRDHVAGRLLSVTSSLKLVGARSRLTAFNDATWLTRYFKMMLVAPVHRHAAALDAIIDEFRPDVIGIDPLLYAGAICAEKSQTPWASLYTTFVPWVEDGWRCAYREALESFHEPLHEVAAGLGSSLRLRIGHSVSPWLNTAYTIPELVASTKSGHLAIPVGPSRALGNRGDETEFPWERLRADRPLVFVTSGTQFLFSERFYGALIEAVRSFEMQLVIAGPSPDEIHDPEVITVPYAPATPLIRRSAMVINHGGPASVMDCLDEGVPMLVVPLGHDQSWQGHFIARCGAGRSLEHDTASVATLRDAIRDIASEASSERAVARRLATRCRSMDGAGRVVELLLELAERGRERAKRFAGQSTPGVNAAPPRDDTPKSLIPNEYHFIFGLAPDFGGRPFSMVHYLAVASCQIVNRPAKIHFHYAHEPSGPWWEKAKPLLNLVQVPVPEEIFGIPLVHVAHKADVLRLQILLEHGGIYLDMDVLCLRPFEDLRDHDVVLGEEHGVGLCNAVILARPRAPFLEKWLSSYASFSNDDWNGHSVRLPRRLAAEMPELVHVVDHRKFFWPTHNREDLQQFFTRVGSSFCAESYCVHLWETVTWDFLRRLTPRHVWGFDSEFFLLARRFVDRPERGR